MSGPEQTRQGWRRFLPENPWAVIVVPILVVLVPLGVTGAIKALTSEQPGPDLQALEPVVHNGAEVDESVTLASNSHLAASRQTDGSKARVEIRLKNNGDRIAYITAAVFTVRKLVAVPPCGVGAAIKVSGHYDVVLPRNADESQAVEIPIDQEIAPDGVDRFVFRVGRKFSYGDIGRTFIYQLDLAVRHDGADEPTEVGRVLLALPGAPQSAALDSGPLGGSREGCLGDEVESLREAAELEGARSPQVARVLTAASG